jgi:hypothetical protein
MRSYKAKPAIRNFLILEGGCQFHNPAYEEKIEGRLERLSQAVDQFVASLPAALLAEHHPTRELLEELLVKQSALQWIVRVAKHSQGTVRRRLWSDIDESLAGLEKLLELLPHLQDIDRHSRAAHENLSPTARSHWS